MSYENHQSPITNHQSPITNKLRTEQGFTLIELSIVIVIIGLIVAGVVGGQTLVRQAKVRAIITEYNAVKLAMNAFKLEYDAIPGDFNRAADYWTGATSGNGNKEIATASTEAIRFWNHLNRADLYPGSYDGTTVMTLGVSIPASKFGNNVVLHVALIKLGGPSGNNITLGAQDLFGVVDNTNVLAFGKMRYGTTGNVSIPFLKVSEASGIDTKIDDGEPDSGFMYSANRAN